MASGEEATNMAGGGVSPLVLILPHDPDSQQAVSLGATRPDGRAVRPGATRGRPGLWSGGVRARRRHPR